MVIICVVKYGHSFGINWIPLAHLFFVCCWWCHWNSMFIYENILSANWLFCITILIFFHLFLKVDFPCIYSYFEYDCLSKTFDVCSFDDGRQCPFCIHYFQVNFPMHIFVVVGILFSFLSNLVCFWRRGFVWLTILTFKSISRNV